MSIYIYCPSDNFSRFIDPPFVVSTDPLVVLPKDPTAQQLSDAECHILVEVAPPAYDPATQNLTQVDPVQAPANVWTQTWSVTAKTTQEQEDYAEQQRRADAIAAIKLDTPVKNLLQATPAEIDTYFATNVTDLDSARNAMNIMARALAVVAQSIFDD
jgi:hypothetical protein